ncbi:YbhN family protein [Streptomyces sp. NPDC059525]|uniref:lysylphosphatidylglycerol synthase transmembrane domain-containing protein n=1 Tax=Streptomyces sp. NPDC059525 TaxID=3346857 RepID=UPI00369CEA91
MDLLRFLMGVLCTVIVLAVSWVAHATTSGVEQDISRGTDHTPGFPISLVGFIAGAAVLVLSVAFAIERLVRRDDVRLTDGVLAAVLAYGVSLATDLWVTAAAPSAIRDALTRTMPTGGTTDPVPGYIASVLAYMTAVGLARRPRWRVALWAVLLLNASVALVGGYSTSLSLLITLLIGWSVAWSTVYVVGAPNVRPTSRSLLAGLRRAGFQPVTAKRVDDAAETPVSDRGRRYRVTLEDSHPIDVTIVDREQQAHAFIHQAWHRMMMRPLGQRRSLQSLRQALEQETLLAHAAIAAGANTPKLIATSELGPDAVMLVYEHIDGCTLDMLPEEQITDAVLDGVWEQLHVLQSRLIAHQRLTGDSLLVNTSGTVCITDLGGGEIAAGDILLRMDTAQLLTTLALRVGPERSVASAMRVLGPDAVANSLPLLQPIALSHSTRATLRRLAKERAERERQALLGTVPAAKPLTSEKGHRSDAAKTVSAGERPDVNETHEQANDGDLLAQIRLKVLRIRPQAPVTPARLERIKPRTLVTLVAGVVAVSYLLTQLTKLDFAATVHQANWTWLLLALAFSALTYVAAAMSLLGFVPEKIPFGRTVLAQLAASFAVAPAAVGGLAVNSRFLQRNNVRPGLAVASVGASQLATGAIHVLLLLTFGYVTGTQHTTSLSPASSTAVIGGLLTAAALVVVVTTIPRLRGFVTTRVRALLAGVVPRMLDLLQRPTKLLKGFGGILLLNLSFIACLDASVRAFGDSLSYPTIAVAYLVGTAAGSAVPTPGGIGGIETALVAALTLAGLPAAVAFPAVLLYRLLTFWLPVLPGWAAFTHLIRQNML